MNQKKIHISFENEILQKISGPTLAVWEAGFSWNDESSIWAGYIGRY